MLFEQNIEFELKGPGPPVQQLLLKLVIFMTKQISLSQIFE